MFDIRIEPPRRSVVSEAERGLADRVHESGDAMAQSERAMELDPLNPLIQAFYSIDLLFARRYDDAIAQAQKALRTAPTMA